MRTISPGERERGGGGKKGERKRKREGGRKKEREGRRERERERGKEGERKREGGREKEGRREREREEEEWREGEREKVRRYKRKRCHEGGDKSLNLLSLQSHSHSPVGNQHQRPL